MDRDYQADQQDLDVVGPDEPACYIAVDLQRTPQCIGARRATPRPRIDAGVAPTPDQRGIAYASRLLIIDGRSCPSTDHRTEVLLPRDLRPRGLTRWAGQGGADASPAIRTNLTNDTLPSDQGPGAKGRWLLKSNRKTSRLRGGLEGSDERGPLGHRSAIVAALSASRSRLTQTPG